MKKQKQNLLIFISGLILLPITYLMWYSIDKTTDFIKNPLGDIQTTSVYVPEKTITEYCKSMSVREKIIFYADLYGVNPETALRVAECESGLNPRAENMDGGATGIYQFIRKTWNTYCGGDVYNPDHNIICFMQNWKTNQHWWEASRGCWQ